MKSKVISIILLCTILATTLLGCSKGSETETNPGSGSDNTSDTTSNQSSDFAKGEQKIVDLMKYVSENFDSLPTTFTDRQTTDYGDGQSSDVELRFIDSVNHVLYLDRTTSDEDIHEYSYTYIRKNGDVFEIIEATQTYSATENSYSDKSFKVLFGSDWEDEVTYHWSTLVACNIYVYISQITEETYVRMAMEPEIYSFKFNDDGSFEVTTTDYTEENEISSKNTDIYKDSLLQGHIWEIDDQTFTDVYTWNENVEYTLPTIDETWTDNSWFKK